MDELLKEVVTEVYELPRPHNSKLKTNSEYKIPPKVILRYRVGPGYGNTLYRVNYHYTQDFIALENVFNALAGHGQISKTRDSQLQMAIEASPDGRGETALFEFRACKKPKLAPDVQKNRLTYTPKPNCGRKPPPPIDKTRRTLFEHLLEG